MPARSTPRYKRALFWLGERIAGIGLWVGAVALLMIVVLNAINIVMRYFFRNPLSWAEEAMLYLMIFGVYIGSHFGGLAAGAYPHRCHRRFRPAGAAQDLADHQHPGARLRC